MLLYLEVAAADPAGETISKLVHFIAVQRCLLGAEIRDKLLADLQTSPSVLGQDAWQKVVQSLSTGRGSHCD